MIENRNDESGDSGTSDVVVSACLCAVEEWSKSFAKQTVEEVADGHQAITELVDCAALLLSTSRTVDPLCSLHLLITRTLHLLSSNSTPIFPVLIDSFSDIQVSVLVDKLRSFAPSPHSPDVEKERILTFVSLFEWLISLGLRKDATKRIIASFTELFGAEGFAVRVGEEVESALLWLLEALWTAKDS
ncbi:hypothetical protein T439DRAFT_175299 [Meredithblackwellia eburnea MCA 4105]